MGAVVRQKGFVEENAMVGTETLIDNVNFEFQRSSLELFCKKSCSANFVLQSPFNKMTPMQV